MYEGFSPRKAEGSVERIERRVLKDYKDFNEGLYKTRKNQNRFPDLRYRIDHIMSSVNSLNNAVRYGGYLSSLLSDLIRNLDILRKQTIHDGPYDYDKIEAEINNIEQNIIPRIKKEIEGEGKIIEANRKELEELSIAEKHIQYLKDNAEYIQKSFEKQKKDMNKMLKESKKVAEKLKGRISKGFLTDEQKEKAKRMNKIAVQRMKRGKDRIKKIKF